MSQQPPPHCFPITRWTAVVKICQEEDPVQREEALAGICRDYWYPLYAFARRMGRSQEDAEDLTQGFFCYLIGHQVLAAASRDLGRLRTFLLAVFQRYIRDAGDRQQAQKRGGGREFVSFDRLHAAELYRNEPVDPVTPETQFERSWALQVLRMALETLRLSEHTESRRRTFAVLAPFLDPESTDTARPDLAARELGLSPEAFRQAISRLRRRFREALRQQISSTLRDPTEQQIDGELAALQAALR